MSTISNELDKLNQELMQHPPSGTMILGEVCRNINDKVLVSYLIRYERSLFRLEIIASYSNSKMHAQVKLLDAKGIESQRSTDTRQFNENDFAHVVKNAVDDITSPIYKVRA